MFKKKLFLKIKILGGVKNVKFEAYLLRNILAVLQVMVSVRKHLWLNNRHQPILKRKVRGDTQMKQCSLCSSARQQPAGVAERKGRY